MIDLRSDTITQPTPAMRKAMAEAPVGDDVFGDDPTVNLLEQETADLLGKEAALFVPSGTMANQLAVRSHCNGGDELLMEARSHVFLYEAGAPAALHGVTCRALPVGPEARGIFGPEHILQAMRAVDDHYSPTRLIWIENTHNVGGGNVWPVKQVAAVAEMARSKGLALHMDGARLWNAAIAAGVPEREYARHCDTVSVCFSKGLGAPVGSALAGPKDLITRARRFRKMLGGGMRQAGIIAAGALHALRHHRQRLAEDHAHAKMLGESLATIPGVTIDGGAVQTNIVRFRAEGVDAKAVAARLATEGLLLFDTGPDTFRAVTNLMVSTEDTTAAARLLTKALG
jgi:threonine aldolase